MARRRLPRELLADPVVREVYQKAFTRSDAEDWIRRQVTRYEADGCGFWIAEERTGGARVGQIGLLRQDLDGVEEFEIGYMIAPHRRRRGYAAEGAAGVRDHAFAVCGRHRLISVIRPMNGASIAVAKRIGMRPERPVTWAGLPHVLFSIRRTAAGDGLE